MVTIFALQSQNHKFGSQRLKNQLSCSITKPTKWPVHPGKTQISLGIHPVWSDTSLCTQWVDNDPMFLHADSEDSDQTGPRLTWVFARRTGHFVGFVNLQLICIKL